MTLQVLSLRCRFSAYSRLTCAALIGLWCLKHLLLRTLPILQQYLLLQQVQQSHQVDSCVSKLFCTCVNIESCLESYHTVICSGFNVSRFCSRVIPVVDATAATASMRAILCLQSTLNQMTMCPTDKQETQGHPVTCRQFLHREQTLMWQLCHSNYVRLSVGHCHCKICIPPIVCIMHAVIL